MSSRFPIHSRLPSGLFEPDSSGTYPYIQICQAQSAAESLVSILGDYLNSSICNLSLDIRNFVFIPIPLHPKKQRERGFNQALVIAEGLKTRLNIFREVPIISNTLFKKEPAKSQTEQKDYISRENNVRMAASA